MSLNPGGARTGGPTSHAGMDPRIAVNLRMRRGAGWFLTIGVLSGVNALLQIFEAKIHFIFGLGIPQVVSAMAHGMRQNGTIITIAIDGLFVVMLILCSRWAKAGSQGAFLGGMIAYALDGALLLLFNILLDAAVLPYAPWVLLEGYFCARARVPLEQDATPGRTR